MSVVAAIASHFPGKDPKVYIDAMYRYEKDYAVFCVEFATKEFADKIKLKGELAVKSRDDDSVVVSCKITAYGARIVRLRLDNVSRGATAQHIADLVESFGIGEVQGIERPTKAVLGSWENLSVVVWLSPHAHVDLAAEQQNISRPAMFFGVPTTITYRCLDERPVCSACGQVGHIGPKCPWKGMCFNCRETGHLRRNCPHPPQTDTSDEEQESVAESDAAEEDTHTGSAAPPPPTTSNQSNSQPNEYVYEEKDPDRSRSPIKEAKPSRTERKNLKQQLLARSSSRSASGSRHGSRAPLKDHDPNNTFVAERPQSPLNQAEMLRKHGAPPLHPQLSDKQFHC